MEEIMIIKRLADIPYANMTGYDKITKQIVIGPRRWFQRDCSALFQSGPRRIEPSSSPRFSTSGQSGSRKGNLIDPEGNEHPLEPGDYVYIHDNQAPLF